MTRGQGRRGAGQKPSLVTQTRRRLWRWSQRPFLWALGRVTTRVAGTRMTIPYDSLFWRQLVALDKEPWAEEIYRLGLQDGAAAIDVGAHIGESMMKIKAISPASPCVCVEPQPACATLLDRVIATNKLSGVTVIVAAAGRISGGLGHITARVPGTGGASLAAPTDAAPDSGAVTAPIKSVDSLVGELGWQDTAIGIIKIDVEGGEYNVLQGAQGLLTRKRPLVLLEILPQRRNRPSPPGADKQAALLQFLADQGYALLQIQKTPRGDGLHGLARVSALPLTVGPTTAPYRDFLAVPNEAVGAVEARLTHTAGRHA